ncbi:hypothetical protein AHAS_Ahas04G0109800 [Arachis hypogaea]
MEVLRSSNLAPSQLHPNSWAFMKMYQLLCKELDVRPTLNILFYLFVVTIPYSSTKKSGWISFRAIQGRKVFSIFDDSFHDFKNHFFKVQGAEGV